MVRYHPPASTSKKSLPGVAIQLKEFLKFCDKIQVQHDDEHTIRRSLKGVQRTNYVTRSKHYIDGNHWVTSSSIGGEVTLYDSNFKGDLSASLSHQLSLVYSSLIVKEEDSEEVDPHIKVYVPTIQQQSGDNDCGVIAVAYALLDDKIETLRFDQSKMRLHLLDGLKKKKLTRFPTGLTRSQRSRHFPYREIGLYCTCLMPETHNDIMIACGECGS